MDAHNLTVVICPNLVSSSNPMRDVMMCSVPNAPTLFDTARAGAPDPRVPAHPMHNAAALAEGKTTLGMVVKLCIERYYEVFDELPDPTEALSQEVVHAPNPFADMPSPGSPSNNRDSAFLDDEEIDDAMLVMPIGPSASNRFQQQGGGGGGSPAATGSSTFRPRHQTSQSRDATARSTHTGFGGQGGGGGSAYATVNKARSTISIERGNPSRKGSIAVGRNTQRGKGAGAGVQAIGITAEGFFSAPDAPPVPTLPSHR